MTGLIKGGSLDLHGIANFATRFLSNLATLLHRSSTVHGAYAWVKTGGRIYYGITVSHGSVGVYSKGVELFVEKFTILACSSLTRVLTLTEQQLQCQQRAGPI